MERKIGEIFEYNGEWYQCVEGLGCNECDLSKITCYHRFESGSCSPNMRKDGTQVIFKKLEKVGEPYVGNNGTFQSYKLAMPIYGDIPDQIIGFTTTEVVIKQNKEDMEESNNAKHSNSEKIGKNLKPFDLQKAKDGKPVCTRDGRKARIICFDAKGDKPIIALVEMGVAETPNNYPIDGKAISTKETPCDLMMLPEKKERWVNVYRNKKGEYWSEQVLFSTKKEAIDFVHDHAQYVTTVKIEWEE